MRAHCLPPRSYVVDFGENLSGWCRISVAGGAGAHVVLDIRAPRNARIACLRVCMCSRRYGCYATPRGGAAAPAVRPG